MNLDEAEEVFCTSNFFWPENSVFRMFARGQGRVFGYAVDTWQQLADATTWCDTNGFNSYWQINPTRRRGGTKCETDDISHWCFLPFDIDPVTDGHIPLLALYEYEDKLVSLMPEDFEVSNRILIDSGRGIQALYPTRPKPMSQGTRYGIAQWMSRLMHRLLKEVGTVHGCVLDTSCSDLPRVMRMPHTINQKTGRKSDFISKGTGDWSIYSLPEMPAPDVHQTVLHVADGADWIDLFGDLTIAAKRFITEGNTEPGRHKAAAATMLSLRERGADKFTTLDALLTGAAISKPRLDPREMVAMVTRKFRKPLTVE